MPSLTVSRRLAGQEYPLKVEDLRIFAVFVAGVLEQLGPPDMADRLTEAMRIRRILAPDPPFKGGP